MRRSVISHQSSVISHQSSVISHQSSVTSHQSPVTSHQFSVTSHQSSVFSHQFSALSFQIRKISHHPALSQSWERGAVLGRGGTRPYHPNALCVGLGLIWILLRKRQRTAALQDASRVIGTNPFARFWSAAVLRRLGFFSGLMGFLRKTTSSRLKNTRSTA
jgi:hypothetical protein